MQQAKTEVAQPAQRSSQLATQHQQRNSSAAQSELSDLRLQATAQRQLQDTANNSPQSHQLNTFHQMAQNSARSTQLKAMSAIMNAPAVQRVEEDEPLSSAPEKKDDNIADGIGKRQGEQFEARGEQHTLWVESVGGMRLIMIASNPVPVVTRLRKWQSAAKKVKDVALKNSMDRLLDLAWKKYGALQNASAIEDGDERARAIRLAQQQLSSDLGQLFRVFGELFEAPPGAVAVYRGLHFTTDWNAKRGHTVGQENARSFEDVKAEGSYSTASWELATTAAKGGKITPELLEAANKIVMETMEGWKSNTDFTRTDSSDPGKKAKQSREGLPGQIIHAHGQGNVPLETALTSRLEGLKNSFTQGGHVYGNQYNAALSRYIDSQKIFEKEMGKGSKGGYQNISFKSIPFISTSKNAKEAVKYGMGKLAKDDVKNTAGIVGRVLVYVAPLTAMLEAGGIDVWDGLRNGTLNFTNYRKNENEITFPGSIPDNFLRAMTPIDAAKSEGDNAQPPEQEAAKEAVPMGGLNPLPMNEDL
ncbi:hypothetical protein H8K38_11900 [Undibacterium sp. FT79W]|uniref:hypothetical protein n=1 Tax=Undibacterium sp. FT79W TaxID=2762296 RepID=UPI00164AEF8D|nr:hypothetical protein [Undibacterium sp. FT79W]MBC3878516.1 hypothetical protein [Undibacterium sp. FT79W]